MTRIAVVGHVEWVDFIPVAHLPRTGEVLHGAGAFARAAGGGGVAAVVLAELGAEVDFYCALGRDDCGRATDAQLTDRGVQTHVAWREEPTRRAMTLLDEAGERAIVTLGERLEPLASDDLDWERLRSADGAYFTAGDAGALRWAREARVLVATARARTALEGAGPTLDALVYSSGDPREIEWAGRAAPRAHLLVATEGARGGHWSGETEGTWAAVPPPGSPRDSYGCGDSFVAAFTLALGAGASVAEAAARGAECGARCLTRPGAP
jgi:ribokinase